MSVPADTVGPPSYPVQNGLLKRQRILCRCSSPVHVMVTMVTITGRSPLLYTRTETTFPFTFSPPVSHPQAAEFVAVGAGWVLVGGTGEEVKVDVGGWDVEVGVGDEGGAVLLALGVTLGAPPVAVGACVEGGEVRVDVGGVTSGGRVLVVVGSSVGGIGDGRLGSGVEVSACGTTSIVPASGVRPPAWERVRWPSGRTASSW